MLRNMELSMSCAAPAVLPLCRSLMISDHLHRIQVTLNQGCFQPCPDLCGKLSAVNALGEPEEFRGSGRKEKCKCAGSQ